MSIPDWMIDAPSPSVDDMAALIRRLVREIRKAAPDNDLADKALDYLERTGLKASILRDDAIIAANPKAKPVAKEMK